jgi:proline-specific peptidase
VNVLRETSSGIDAIDAARLEREEGYVEVPGGRVWYESLGSGSRTLLLLHGGPGGNSEDLRPLSELAAADFRVVRYDQLGSWRSPKPDDPTLWQVPRFVMEVERVRQALGPGQIHLLGQSWGAMLALEYALHHQEHLYSLTLASGAASVAACVAGMNAWRAELPVETQQTLERYETTQEYDHPDYLAAVGELYRRHLCQAWPPPEAFTTATKHMALPVYRTMWGPNEFTCTGSLLAWDRSDRLGEIRAPTLITVGEFDEVHPSYAKTMHQGISGSRLAIFAGASHTVHVERPEEYWSVVRQFLLDVDGDQPAGS